MSGNFTFEARSDYSFPIIRLASKTMYSLYVMYYINTSPLIRLRHFPLAQKISETFEKLFEGQHRICMASSFAKSKKETKNQKKRK